jgi:hypothetical protein
VALSGRKSGGSIWPQIDWPYLAATQLALCARKFTPGLKVELEKCVVEFRRLRTDRNNIVHGLWLSTKSPPLFKLVQKGRKATPQIAKVTAKGELKVTKTLWTAKKIADIASEIDDLNLRMIRLHTGIEEDVNRRLALAEALLVKRTLAHVPDPKTTERIALRDIGK